MPEYRNPDVPVVTFVAYRKSDSEQIVVDDRTFDPETMSLEPVTVNDKETP